jgi:excisionase family DNA binding protein
MLEGLVIRMDDLLTVRQVQDLLKIDRITVYRMLQDGRLKGVKIGQQWRFSSAEIQRFLMPLESAEAGAQITLSKASDPGATRTRSPQAFPTHCVQVIQDLYAGMGKISAMTVDLDAVPLTAMSSACQLCALIESTPTGRAACQRSRELAIQSPRKDHWIACHAGLFYRVVPIHENSQPVAYFFSGQIYLSVPNAREELQRMQELAKRHGLEEDELLRASREVPTLNSKQLNEMETWPTQFSRAIENILNERAGLVERLQKIAEISTQ